MLFSGKARDGGAAARYAPALLREPSKTYNVLKL